MFVFPGGSPAWAKVNLILSIHLAGLKEIPLGKLKNLERIKCVYVCVCACVHVHTYVLVCVCVCVLFVYY